MSARKTVLRVTGTLVLALALLVPFYNAAAAQNTIADTINARLLSETPFSGLTGDVPTIAKPKWYTDVTFYYTVGQMGTVNSNFSEFETDAGQTLNDARGWTRIGIQFKEVASGGTLHIILIQPSLLPTVSSGCTADWSCTVGNTVYINDERWASASDSWNAAGGSLRDYRHMVINHETGHWLGHGHEHCGGAGQLAPVMQQQSIDLEGCKFNPWPLDSELWTTRL
jgi:hypothetical protein